MESIQYKFESTRVLKEYGSIPISFEVHSHLNIKRVKNGLGGIIFEEAPVEHSYCVDFDAEKGMGPERWKKRWNTEKWVIVSAFHQGSRVGGAVIAYDTPAVNILEGRKDIAALWDLRIDYSYRGKGIGSSIFRKCLEWAKSQKCHLLKIECQNNNVHACNFYAKQGAALGEVNLYAYPDKPEVAQLMWYYSL